MQFPLQVKNLGADFVVWQGFMELHYKVL